MSGFTFDWAHYDRANFGEHIYNPIRFDWEIVRCVFVCVDIPTFTEYKNNVRTE